MTRDQARRKHDALRRMTTARGATPHEAATAARLADVLARKWGFGAAPAATAERPQWDDRYARAEARAAQRYRWEYRRCGKRNCHCADRSSWGHGPYRYSKRREGRTVRSIYLGRG